GVKVHTEGLAHDLRNRDGCRVTAHLLVPGYTFTGMTARGGDKPPAAWTADQVVEFMLEHLAAGDFYILCPDNEVTRAIDERRIQWAADDIIQNRPALSRWHPDWADAFCGLHEVVTSSSASSRRSAVKARTACDAIPASPRSRVFEQSSIFCIR